MNRIAQAHIEHEWPGQRELPGQRRKRTRNPEAGLSADIARRLQRLAKGARGAARGGNYAPLPAGVAALWDAADEDARSFAVIEPHQVPQIRVTGARLAFVGGLGDSFRSGRIKGACKAYVRQCPDSDIRYFTFDQAKQLAAYIDAHRGEVTVIAHSYGADTAAKVVAAGRRVRRLVTLDPVSRFPPSYRDVAKNAGQWINFVAAGGGSLNTSNMIAGLGGCWGRTPAAFADRCFAVNLNHAAIGNLTFIEGWLKH